MQGPAIHLQALVEVNEQHMHHPGARNKPMHFDAAKKKIYQQALSLRVQVPVHFSVFKYLDSLGDPLG